MLYIIILFSANLLAKTENYLRYTSIKKNQLNLIFKYNIESVNYFTIKQNGFVKHVYDIKKTSFPRSKDISHYRFSGIRSFRIAQFNKKTIRVVIEASAKMRGRYVVNGRKLEIYLPSSKGVKSLLPKKKYRYNPKRKSKTIILDAGHGGRDIGASSENVREKDLTLAMTLKLKTILTKMGYKVLLTHSKDTFLNLRRRTEYANRHNGSLFVSIHANAAPVKRTPRVRYEGIEVFYLSIKNSKRVKNQRAVYRGKKVYSKRLYRKMVSRWKISESFRLARDVKKSILKEVRRHYSINDKGIKRRDFWVLLATKMPSILVETGYLTDKNELKKLKNPDYQTKMMEGIARGINEYYGFK